MQLNYNCIGCVIIGAIFGISNLKTGYKIIFDIIVFIIWTILYLINSNIKYHETHIENIPYPTYMTNEEAEQAYKTGKARLNLDKEKEWSYVEKYVPCGFFSEELTFEQWLKRYNIKII